MLSEAVDAFFLVKRFEYTAYGVAFGAFDFDWGEFTPAVGFGNDQAAVFVIEFDIAG